MTQTIDERLLRPIIYVRGFAATQTEIEETVATPYMGFNLGATKIRQDHQGKIVRFIFESPLIRLIKEYGYQDTFLHGRNLLEQSLEEDETPPRATANSIWIFRFYEQASRDLGSGERQTIPEIAADLRSFILQIRDNICGNNADAAHRFRVYLVAHSMGGLICRCYLQNICVHGTGDARRDEELELTSLLKDQPGFVPDETHLVDKVFTYATPHNGIEFGGVNVPDVGWLDPYHTFNFNRRNMHDYLKLPGSYERHKRVSSLNGRFPVERFFCLVGSNYNDYMAFHQMSRKATGVMSDGLVMINNAAVAGAPRAVVHRSHSGHYGIVNSEEGYQNLRRFLFGDVRVDAWLITHELTLPENVQEQLDRGRQIRGSYKIETAVKVRGGTYYLQDRQERNGSAILRSFEYLITQHKPVYLFTGYLLRQAKMPRTRDTALAFAVDLKVGVPLFEVERRFWFDSHFEGGKLFEETFTFMVRLKPDEMTVSYGLRSSSRGVGTATRRVDLQDLGAGVRQLEIPVGFKENVRNKPRPALRGTLRLTTRPWNDLR